MTMTSLTMKKEHHKDEKKKKKKNVSKVKIRNN